jgi:hypothetical protein
MTPIVEIVQGQQLTFLLSKTALDAVLTRKALFEAFAPQSRTLHEAMAHHRQADGGRPGSAQNQSSYTQSMWAAALGAGGDAATSQVPPDQIRAILREALIGGGMARADAIGTAERLHQSQLNRAVDYLTSRIAKAAIAAG